VVSNPVGQSGRDRPVSAFRLPGVLSAVHAAASDQQSSNDLCPAALLDFFAGADNQLGRASAKTGRFKRYFCLAGVYRR